MNLRSVLTVLVVAGILLAASEPWTKPPAQWTADDINRILTDSPWAQQAGGGSGGSASTVGGDYPRRGSVPGEQSRDDSRVALRPVLPAVIVRWESALPIKLALQQSMAASQSRSQPPSGEAYIIGLIGLPLGSRDPETVHEELVELTTLTPKGKAAVAPSAVKLPESGRGEVLFYFPKTEAIALADKEVTFETNLGPLRIGKKFVLKDMVYAGKLEL